MTGSLKLSGCSLAFEHKSDIKSFLRLGLRTSSFMSQVLSFPIWKSGWSNHIQLSGFIQSKESASFSTKGQVANILRLLGQMDTVAATLLCRCALKAGVEIVNEWA